MNANHYKQGSYLYQRGRFEEALEELKSARTKEPENWMMYDKLADCFKITGLFDQGENYFRRILSEEPSNGWAKIGLAKIRFLKGSSVSAFRHLEEARKDFTSESNRTGLNHVRYYENYIRALMGELHDISEELQDQLDCFLSDDDKLGAAKTLTFMGKLNEILGIGNKACGFYEKALQMTEAIGDYDRSGILHIDLTRCWLKEKKTEEAGRHLEEAEKISEEHGSAIMRMLLLHTQGELSAREEKMEQAKGLLEEAMHIADELALPYSRIEIQTTLAKCLIDAGDFKTAAYELELILDSAIDLNDKPSILAACKQLVRAYYGSGDKLKALEYARKGIHLLDEFLEGFDDQIVIQALRSDNRELHKRFVELLDELDRGEEADEYRQWT